MKIKDLDPKANLGGIKVRTPDGQEGYWESQWQKGVWLCKLPPGTQGSRQIHPIFVGDLKETLEWDIIELEPPRP